MERKIERMFEMQQYLNNTTNGTSWVKGVTKEGRKIDWFRCICFEAYECGDSLNWKHWKDINAKDDLNNVKIELTDVFHFLMSQMIVEHGDEYAAAKYFNNTLANTVYYDNDPDNLLEALEEIVKAAIYKKTPVEEFIKAMELVDGFNFGELYTLYIGKNTLNEFRQKHGYKNGCYVKMWDGEEDNVFMQKTLDTIPDITPLELFQSLENKYIQVLEQEVKRVAIA